LDIFISEKKRELAQEGGVFVFSLLLLMGFAWLSKLSEIIPKLLEV